MGNFYDLAQSRARKLRQAEERIANLRMLVEEYDDQINQLNNLIMDLRDEIAGKDRRIEDLEAATWRPHF